MRDLLIVPLSHNDCLQLDNDTIDDRIQTIAGSIKPIGHQQQDLLSHLQMRITVSSIHSGPMMALCLAREDAVEGWRELLGPKDISEAVDQAPER